MSGPHPIRQSPYLVLDDRIVDEVIAAELTLGEITKHPQNPHLANLRGKEIRLRFQLHNAADMF